MILSICGEITKILLNKNVTTFVQKKYIFFLHEELQKLTDYVDWIRDPNLNEAFWWYNKKIWNGKDVPDNVTMSW